MRAYTIRARPQRWSCRRIQHARDETKRSKKAQGVSRPAPQVGVREPGGRLLLIKHASLMRWGIRACPRTTRMVRAARPASGAADQDRRRRLKPCEQKVKKPLQKSGCGGNRCYKVKTAMSGKVLRFRSRAITRDHGDHVRLRAITCDHVRSRRFPELNAQCAHRAWRNV